MSEDYTSMWESLGLDLVAHDALLEVLGKGYQDIYLAQKDRPEGMRYFDFVMSEVHGLRIKELLDEKAAGRKVIGSFCVFVPEEIVRAADATLVGLCTGADFATEEVEKLLPRNTCSLIKSAFGFKLGKVCPYLESADMIVGENTCDGKKKSYEILKDLVPNLYVMDIPQMKSAEGRALMKAEYLRFKEAVEKLTGVTIDAARLKKGIEIVNNKRKAIHRLAGLRKADPSPISGLDALLANQVFFYDDPVRFTDSVNKICDELEKRIENNEGVFPKETPRVLLSGCP
ncbi:MAG: 2-hydroxyacyl-CoA dehydratase, partial [Deltaproteobacteria bacterium]|nr:2-hydroxyacyl-CoA dehydratase [Deltaproteobacteria bacterium]